VYFASQHAIAASAIATFSWANNRAFRNEESWCLARESRSSSSSDSERARLMSETATLFQRKLALALGTKDKVFKRYDGGHANLVTRPDLIGEILNWLDKSSALSTSGHDARRRDAIVSREVA
jgi:hypothetical protein